MPSKPFELPPNVAQAFAKDMRAFFAASPSLKQDEIAARQMHALNEHRQPRGQAASAGGRETELSKLA